MIIDDEDKCKNNTILIYKNKSNNTYYIGHKTRRATIKNMKNNLSFDSENIMDLPSNNKRRKINNFTSALISKDN